MTLFHLLVIDAVFLSGVGLGFILARVVPSLNPWASALLFGGIAVLSLTSFVYRKIGLLPPAPPCPRDGCSGGKYGLVSNRMPDEFEFQCSTCGQHIVLSQGTVSVLNDDGLVERKLRLASPQFLGKWK